MTMQPTHSIDSARRRAERIRIKARSITEQYAELRALVDEAERNEDYLTLGYQSWTAYLTDVFGDEPLRLPRDARIPMSNMLAEKGMSTRAIGSMLGVHHDTVATDIRAGVGNPTPERINPATGEVVPGPTYRPTDVTDWTPQEVDDLVDADERELEAWKASTVPAPAKVVGLDGKTYTRPEPKPAEPRDYTPEPKRGTDAHALRYVVVPTLSAWSDLWAPKSQLDNTVDAEEAAQLLRDLSKLTPVLSQIRRLLTSRTESTQ